MDVIFNNHTTPVGTTFNLGTFTAAQSCYFASMRNRAGKGTHARDYFTGPASRNPDNIAHAKVDGQYALNTSYVGFEDVYGGGNLITTISSFPLRTPGRQPSGARNTLAIGNRSWGNGYDKKTA